MYIYIYIYIYICIYIYIYICIYIKYISQSFLHAFVVLCYLPKLERNMALVFSAYFLYTY